MQTSQHSYLISGRAVHVAGFIGMRPTDTAVKVILQTTDKRENKNARRVSESRNNNSWMLDSFSTERFTLHTAYRFPVFRSPPLYFYYWSQLQCSQRHHFHYCRFRHSRIQSMQPHSMELLLGMEMAPRTAYSMDRWMDVQRVLMCREWKRSKPDLLDSRPHLLLDMLRMKDEDKICVST